MIEILTYWQQERFNEFEEAINRKQMLFRNGKYRGVGKTYLLNELALTLQALGYDVYICTPFTQLEYFAEKFIHWSSDLWGISVENKVILFDEVKIEGDNTIHILELCELHSIPAVGFVRYKEDNEPKQFKMEYECKWVKD